jgi:4-amino-4-deoxy-L-arabinose transferase-like glycosyltransferase
MSLLTAKIDRLHVDEIYTCLVSRMDSFGAIWAGLLAVRDNHPPLDYWVRHAIMSIFGRDEMAFRSFSMVAFAIGVFAAYRFVRPRMSVVCGLVALLVPFSTPVYDLSFSGRYQSATLACGGLALLSWRSAAEGRKSGTLGLALSLGTGLFFDYNSVLLFVPIAIAELARTAATRRLDIRIWIALAVAGFSLFVLLPLVQVVRQFSGRRRRCDQPHLHRPLPGCRARALRRAAAGAKYGTEFVRLEYERLRNLRNC